MKVLLVFNHPAPYKVKQFNALARIVDLTVLFERETASDRNKNFYKDNEYNFRHIFFLDGYYGKENSRTKKVRDYLKSHHQEYDVIVMNGYSTSAERRAIRYLNKNHIPYTLLINGGLIKAKESFIKKWYKSKYISSAAKYLSPSPVADEYLIYYGAKKENVYRYTYSSLEEKDVLDKPLTKIAKQEIRKQLSLPENQFIYIAPNQFIERKNNKQLIRLFKNRKEVLLLIGQGEEKVQYKQIIENENIDNVILVDNLPRETLFNYYKASDAVISLSKEDIFGHTIVEGFAFGLPCIASDKILSAKTLVNNGDNGYLVSIENDENIINALNNINKCDPKCCIQTAKENTIDTTISKIKECLK